MIEVTDVALRQAAGEGMDAFIGVFTGAYKKENRLISTGQKEGFSKLAPK